MHLWCNPAIFWRISAPTRVCGRLEWVAKGWNGFRWADWYGLGWSAVGWNRSEWAQMGYYVQMGDGLQWVCVGWSGLRWVKMGYHIQKDGGLQWAQMGYSRLWWVNMSTWIYVNIKFMVRSKVLHIHVVFTVTDESQRMFIVQLRDLSASGSTIIGLTTGSHFCPFGTPVAAFIPRFMVTNIN